MLLCLANVLRWLIVLPLCRSRDGNCGRKKGLAAVSMSLTLVSIFLHQSSNGLIRRVLVTSPNGVLPTLTSGVKVCRCDQRYCVTGAQVTDRHFCYRYGCCTHLSQTLASQTLAIARKFRLANSHVPRKSAVTSLQSCHSLHPFQSTPFGNPSTSLFAQFFEGIPTSKSLKAAL